MTKAPFYELLQTSNSSETHYVSASVLVRALTEEELQQKVRKYELKGQEVKKNVGNIGADLGSVRVPVDVGVLLLG